MKIKILKEFIELDSYFLDEKKSDKIMKKQIKLLEEFVKEYDLEQSKINIQDKKNLISGVLAADIRKYWGEQVNDRCEIIECISGYKVDYNRLYLEGYGCDGRYFRDEWSGPYNNSIFIPWDLDINICSEYQVFFLCFDGYDEFKELYFKIKEKNYDCLYDIYDLLYNVIIGVDEGYKIIDY